MGSQMGWDDMLEGKRRQWSRTSGFWARAAQTWRAKEKREEELLSASEIKRGWAQRRRDDVSVDVWDAGDVSVCVCPFVLAVFVRKGVCMAQGVCGVL